MNTEQEIWRLAGEAIATQNVLVGLCIGLSKSGDAGHKLVVDAFNYADAAVEIAAAKLGPAQPRAHLTAAVNVTAQLRRSALGDDGGPKEAV